MGRFADGYDVATRSCWKMHRGSSSRGASPQHAEGFREDERGENADHEEDAEEEEGDTTLEGSNSSAYRNYEAGDESDEDDLESPGKKQRQFGQDYDGQRGAYYTNSDENDFDDRRRPGYQYDQHAQEEDDDREQDLDFRQEYRQDDTLQHVYDQTVNMDAVLDASAEKTQSTARGLSKMSAARERKETIKRQLRALTNEFKDNMKRTTSQLEAFANQLEEELDAEFDMLNKVVQGQLAQNNALELRIRNATEALMKNRPALDIILKVVGFQG